MKQKVNLTKSRSRPLVLDVMSNTIPRTARQIAVDAGISDKTASYVLRAMRTNGEVHVASYHHPEQGGSPTAQWLLGDGVSANRGASGDIEPVLAFRHPMDCALFGDRGMSIDGMILRTMTLLGYGEVIA